MAIFPRLPKAGKSLRQAQITILEILKCIPARPVKCGAYFSGVVLIFAFLDLEKSISFSDSLLRQFWFLIPKLSIL